MFRLKLRIGKASDREVGKVGEVREVREVDRSEKFSEE